MVEIRPKTVIKIIKKNHLKKILKLLHENGYGVSLTSHLPHDRCNYLYVYMNGGVSYSSERCHEDWYYVKSDELLPAEDTITIYRKGNSVFAKSKRFDITTEAKCSPDDEFDFVIGARIAFNRLVGSSGTPQKTYKMSEIDIFEETVVNPAANEYDVKSISIRDKKTGEWIFEATRHQIN